MTITSKAPFVDRRMMDYGPDSHGCLSEITELLNDCATARLAIEQRGERAATKGFGTLVDNLGLLTAEYERAIGNALRREDERDRWKALVRMEKTPGADFRAALTMLAASSMFESDEVVA